MTSSESDVVQTLCEKVRSQAKRLAFLENYKLICERRISELSPTHPLPVTAEMLGIESHESMQLHQAMQKIERLEQELRLGESPSFGTGRDNESLLIVLREKSILEETYRKEVERSEEQRALVETLKQALEAKMDKISLCGNPTAIAALAKAQEQADLYRKEVAKLKSALRDQTAINDEIVDVVREKDEKLKAVESEYAKVQRKLDAVLRDKSGFETASQGLESENLELKTHIEDLENTVKSQTTTISALTSDLRKVTTEQKSLLKQQQEVTEKLQATEQLAQELTEQRELLTTENFTQQLKSTQHQASAEAAQNTAKEQLATIRLLSEQLSEIKAKGEAMQRTQESLVADKRTLQSAVEQLKADLASATSEKSHFQSALNTAKQELGEKEAAEFRAKGEIAELKRALKVLWDGSEAAARSAQAQDNDLSRKIKGLEMEKEALEVELAKEKENYGQLSAAMKEKLGRTESESQEKIKAVVAEREMVRSEASDRVKAMENELRRLSQGISSLELQLTDSKRSHDQALINHKETLSKLQLSEESRNVTLKEMEEIRSQFSTAKVAITRYQETTKMLEEELNAISMDFERNRSEVETENEELKSENRHLKLEFETLHADLEELKDSLYRMQQDLLESRTREQSAIFASDSHKQSIYAAKSSLKTYIDQLQRHLHVPKAIDLDIANCELSEVVAAVSPLVESIKVRLENENRAIDTLKIELKEANSVREKSEKSLASLESRYSKVVNKESSIASELKTLQDQLSTERLVLSQRAEKAKSQSLTLDSQLQSSREELIHLKERLQRLLEDNDDILKENAHLQVAIQTCEAKTLKKDGEMKRIDRVLNLVLSAMSAGTDLRRILVEIVEANSALSRIDANKDESELRLAELEIDSSSFLTENFDLQKKIISERSAILRLETERETLEKRILDLEYELSHLKSTPTDPLSRTTLTKPPLSSYTQRPELELTSKSRLNRYDPRISPLLTNSIESRLSVTKLGDRLMQTAPLTRGAKDS